MIFIARCQCFPLRLQRTDQILLAFNTDGDFKQKPILTYHSKNPSALKNYTKSILPVIYNRATKLRQEHICLQHGLVNILSPLFRPAAWKKGCLSNIITY